MRTVLLVDDDEMFREMIEFTIARDFPNLQVIGFAADGIEAVRQAVALQPDIILMDQRMPGLTGIEAAVRIRQSMADVRIYLLSAAEEMDHGALDGICDKDYDRIISFLGWLSGG